MKKVLKIPASRLNNACPINDSVYRKALKRLLNSFERFPVANETENCGNPTCEPTCELTSFALETFLENREILINWLPHCLQACEIEPGDPEMAMFIDISNRIREYLRDEC